MSKCRNCENEANLIKAHVIPEAFFREHRNGDEAPIIVSGTKHEAFQKSPIGVYDKGILCKDCEGKLNAIDAYGIDTLLKNFDKLFLPEMRTNKTVCFESINADKHLILHFLIAVLWRASVSTQKFYKHVKLGPHEQAAKLITFNKNNQHFGVFDAVLSKWTDDQKNGFTAYPLLDPHPEKWLGVNAYRIYFGDIVAYIKVDKRHFPSPLRSNSLLNSNKVRVISRNISKSNDLQVMLHTNNSSIHANNLKGVRNHGKN